MSTREHYFKRTTRTKVANGKTLTIFECKQCNSEVAFDGKMTEGDVNRAVLIRWPRFACIPPIIN